MFVASVAIDLLSWIALQASPRRCSDRSVSRRVGLSSARINEADMRWVPSPLLSTGFCLPLWSAKGLPPILKKYKV
jgi:hypothetical protein